MAANFLKLNDDKTELVILGNPKRLANPHDFELSVRSIEVNPAPCAKNLGAYFDSSLSFQPIVQTTAAAAAYHVRSLVAIRNCCIDKLLQPPAANKPLNDYQS